MDDHSGEEKRVLKSFKEVEGYSVEERIRYYDDLRTLCRNRRVKKCTNHTILRILNWVFPLLRKFDIEIKGRENITGAYPHIFLCNHSNSHDLFIVREVFYKLGKDVTPLVAWDGLNFLSRFLFRINDCTFINRAQHESKESGILDLCSKIINGKNGLIFGEATWNLHPSNPMQSIHAGVAEVSLITGKPVIPVIFEYVETDRICKKESDLYKKVIVTFGKPVVIDVSDSLFEQTDNLQGIMESMRREIWAQEDIVKDITSDEYIKRYINHTYLKKYKALGFKYITEWESQFLLSKGQRIENEYCLDEGSNFVSGILREN